MGLIGNDELELDYKSMAVDEGIDLYPKFEQNSSENNFGVSNRAVSDDSDQGPARTNRVPVRFGLIWKNEYNFSSTFSESTHDSKTTVLFDLTPDSDESPDEYSWENRSWTTRKTIVTPDWCQCSF